MNGSDLRVGLLVKATRTMWQGRTGVVGLIGWDGSGARVVFYDGDFDLGSFSMWFNAADLEPASAVDVIGVIREGGS